MFKKSQTGTAIYHAESLIPGFLDRPGAAQAAVDSNQTFAVNT